MAAQVPGAQWRWKVAPYLGAISGWETCVYVPAVAPGQPFSEAAANPPGAELWGRWAGS